MYKVVSTYLYALKKVRNLGVPKVVQVCPVRRGKGNPVEPIQPGAD